MAEIWQLQRSILSKHLEKAIDYIVDPAKTDDKLLVSSFGCAVETADLEFEKHGCLLCRKATISLTI